jgi:hypothetical protein
LVGYISYRKYKDHFCLSCSKRCFHCSVSANRKNAVAGFLTPERKGEETTNIQAFWDVKLCPMLITSTAIKTSVSPGNRGRKRKKKSGFHKNWRHTHSNRWAGHVARASPNFLSHMKAYFIALSKNWYSFVLLRYYAAYVGSCLPTFRIVYRSQLQVSRGPNKMQGNHSSNQQKKQPTDQTDRTTDRSTNQPTNQRAN